MGSPPSAETGTTSVDDGGGRPRFDMRGLSPADVQSLLGHAINYRNVLGGQELRGKEAQAKALQDQVENFYRQQTALRENQKVFTDTNKLNRSAVYTADDKAMIDWTDALGNVVKREVVGDARDTSQAMKLVKLPDGTVRSIDPQKVTDLPAGTTLLGTGEQGEKGQLTEYQKGEQEIKLARIDQMMAKGTDEKGNEVDPELMAGFADFYNARNPSNQWIMVPGTPGMFGKSPKWAKIPKSGEGILKLPAETVLGRTSKGTEVTVEMVKKKAETLGVSPEEVLKQLSLVR